MGERRKSRVRAILGLGAALVALGVGFAGWQISHALRAARQEVRSEQTLSFVSRPYVSPATQLFESVSALAAFEQAAQFQNHLFLAGPAGLVEYDASGSLLRSFAPGRELPSSPLVVALRGRRPLTSFQRPSEDSWKTMVRLRGMAFPRPSAA